MKRMFDRIERQIRLVFSASVALCIVLLSTIACIAIRRNSINNILQLSRQYSIEQQNNFHLHLDQIENNVQKLLNSPDIKARLRSSIDNSNLDIEVINQLTTIQSLDLNIAAITLYNADGLYRQSQSNRLEPYTPPPLGKLLANPAMERFIHSDRPAIWFARHEDRSIPGEIVYYYRLRRGVYTLVCKIFDPNGKIEGRHDLGRGVSGLLLVDVDLVTVFTEIFADTSGIETYIVTSEDKILRSESSVSSPESIRADIIAKDRINQGPYIARNGQTVLAVTQSPRSSDRIALAIPISSMNRQFLLMTLFLILIDCGLIALAAAMGKTVARSIAVPLAELYQQMKEGK